MSYSVDEVVRYLERKINEIVRQDNMDVIHSHDGWDTARLPTQKIVSPWMKPFFDWFFTLSGDFVTATVADSFSELPQQLVFSEGEADVDLMVFASHVYRRQIIDERPLHRAQPLTPLSRLIFNESGAAGEHF